MSENADDLWRRLQTFLATRGDLPLRHDMLTPAEIAGYVRSHNGDSRTQRFVWHYYYPRWYGQGPGRMSDEEAADLVGSFESRPPPDSLPITPENPGPVCTLCGHRAARGARH